MTEAANLCVQCIGCKSFVSFASVLPVSVLEAANLCVQCIGCQYFVVFASVLPVTVLSLSGFSISVFSAGST